MRDAADALDYLHCVYQRLNVEPKAYVYHRDVKPDNMLLRDGILKLSDFSIVATMRFYLTEGLGTMRYLPQNETYTAAIDIYSWALCFYYALSNVKPHATYDDEALTQVSNDRLTSFQIHFNSSKRSGECPMQRSTSSSATFIVPLLKTCMR